jgi:hypothetical protein
MTDPEIAPSDPWPAIGIAGEVPTRLDGKIYAEIIRLWITNCDKNH